MIRRAVPSTIRGDRKPGPLTSMGNTSWKRCVNMCLELGGVARSRGSVHDIAVEISSLRAVSRRD